MSKIVRNTGKYQDDQEDYSGGGGGGVTSFNSRTGAVTPQSGDYNTSQIGTSINGLVKGNGSALSAATSGTDYAPATSGTSILKGNGSGGFSNAASGTDYAPATSGTGILRGDGSGGFTSGAAFANLTDFTAWTDYAATTTIVGLTSLTTKQMQYMVMAKTIFVFIDFRCASPNGSGTTTTFTIPFNASSWSGEQRGLIHGVNSTTQGACLWKIASGSNIVEVAIGANDTAFSSWTNSTARRIEGFLMINIA